ncbi:MAG TPA: DUF72 domain-containing protein [Terriglobales bacterium]|nr:DUF72 domain-containing protein [Terriglobales bacterium]
MHKVHIGTSGWAYASWKPEFYPPKTPSSKFLDYYSTQLNCVEVNYTYRARPAVKTLQNWAAVTPEDFTFVTKAHQRITHIKRLNDVEQDVDAFFASLQPLLHAHKLGPVLFQLPPNFKADPEKLRKFLRTLPKDAPSAIEFRNPSWFQDPIYELMREQNVALCIAESDELAVPEVFTADFTYYRLRKSDYSDHEIAEVEQRLRNAAQQREVYAFLKHEDTPEGAINARKLLTNLTTKQASAL